MKRHHLLIALILLIDISASSDTKTLRPNLKRIDSDTPVYADVTLLKAVGDSVIINNYDKPLRSTRETFFLTNRCATSTVSIIAITITYQDTNGNMLHRRSLNVGCDVPPGETRQLSIHSWDKQLAYYHLGTRVTPRSPKAIAYKAKIVIDGAIFE